MRQTEIPPPLINPVCYPWCILALLALFESSLLISSFLFFSSGCSPSVLFRHLFRSFLPLFSPSLPPSLLPPSPLPPSLPPSQVSPVIPASKGQCVQEQACADGAHSQEEGRESPGKTTCVSLPQSQHKSASKFIKIVF